MSATSRPVTSSVAAIAEKLRVNYAAIAGEKVTDLEGALQALYKLEEIYGLYPTEVDGQIHFVFRDSVAMDKFKPDLDTVMGSPGALLQYRALGFMKACALHDAGELNDEEYLYLTRTATSKTPKLKIGLRNWACNRALFSLFAPIFHFLLWTPIPT